MPIIYQSRVYRTDLRANQSALYVFGDNAQRYGMAGQAKEMRGEPNAVGIATKWSPTMQEDAFFSDDRFEEQREIMAKDLCRVIHALNYGRVVVWPLDDIGTGLSALPGKSPKTWAWFNKFRSTLPIQLGAKSHP